ncbi:MAG: hypothetical protein QM770_04510 [Tepidisphaeraceae bacterium]
MRIRPSGILLAALFAVLLEGQAFDDLLAGDLAHLGEHASDRPALELVDRRHAARVTRVAG